MNIWRICTGCRLYAVIKYLTNLAQYLACRIELPFESGRESWSINLFWKGKSEKVSLTINYLIEIVTVPDFEELEFQVTLLTALTTPCFFYDWANMKPKSYSETSSHVIVFFIGTYIVYEARMYRRKPVLMAVFMVLTRGSWCFNQFWTILTLPNRHAFHCYGLWPSSQNPWPHHPKTVT